MQHRLAASRFGHLRCTPPRALIGTLVPLMVASASPSVTWLSARAQSIDTGPMDTLPEIIEGAPFNQVKPSVDAPVPTAQPGVDVNASNLAGNESEVSIDINPTNPLNQVIVGHAPNFATMNTFFTANGGATWTLVALGDAQDGLTSTFRFDPTVAFDDNGIVYAAYGARIAGPSVAVVVCRSTNGGQTYPQCTTVATTASIPQPDGSVLPGNDKWHLATGPDPVNPAQQDVYIAWTQNIQEGANVDQRIVVSRSTNGGATFSPPLTINDASIAGTSAGNLFADPAVGPNGEVYVSWNSINTGQILVDRSFNGGATFGADRLVTTENVGFARLIPPQPDRGIASGPTLDTDRSGGSFNGRLYLAYADLNPEVFGGATQIFVRFSADRGANWSARTLVDDDAGVNFQFLPWLDVDQATGAVNAVWYDTRNDPSDRQVNVFFALSDDGGLNFGPNIQISDNPSDQSVNNPNRTVNNFLEYIGVASLACEVFPVWSDNSTNLADLDYFTDQVLITAQDTPLCPIGDGCHGDEDDDDVDDDGLTGDSDDDDICDENDNCVREWNRDQLDSNADGFGNACDADFDDDGYVGSRDYLMLSRAFASRVGDAHYCVACDTNSDGAVGGPDYLEFRAQWLRTPGPSGLACAGTAPCP